MDPDAWPHLRKPKGSGLFRPVKRPRLNPSSDADYDQDHNHDNDGANHANARKYAPSGAFADMVSGLDFALGVQSKASKHTSDSRRVVSTPKKRVVGIDSGAFEPLKDLQAAARNSSVAPSTPLRSGMNTNTNTLKSVVAGSSKETIYSKTKKPVVFTPMKPPPSPFVRGEMGNRTPLSSKLQRGQGQGQGQPSPKPMMTAMISRIPQFQLPARPHSPSTPLKKTVPLQALPIRSPASISLASPRMSAPATGPAHSISETKDALEVALALARGRDQGKGKAKEMRAMSEVKVDIDWADGELMRRDGHAGSSDVEHMGKEMKELRRGLLVSPEKGGRGGKKGKFVRGGLAEAAQMLISRAQTDYTLWSREVERGSSSKSQPIHCDARLRIRRVLHIQRSASRSRGAAARTILTECEVIDAEEGSVFDIVSSSGSKCRAIAPPPWAPQQVLPPEPLIARVLFSIALESSVSMSSKLFVPVYAVTPIAEGSEVCVWEPWYSVGGKSRKSAKMVSSEGNDSKDGKVGSGLRASPATIFCSRFLVLPQAKAEKVNNAS